MDLTNDEIYLLIAADYLASKTNKDHPSMLTLIERRESLIFWANRKCHKPPPRNIMISRTDPVMLFARKKYDMNDPPSVKIYFGRSELVQLLDFDMNITTAIEVAEQHHLAWTISWVCGIRPSSIGTHPNSLNAYMKWEDFEITRLYDKNDQPIIGGFVMLATIAYLRRDPSLTSYNQRFIQQSSQFTPLIFRRMLHYLRHIGC
ncbi:uncharacterized protein EAF02_000108 [Botrytis sinoallii]|uniref:uncharacterized protein n=1 Tax=Botrytis sinoallii TaxID=1463999 RepID=UPI0019021EA3|nr:uncharacterized protein EAF02_000108 [Botrytis sinoallii]KAF7892570.1 hypothetical protein EAF02_000108 [Botrytis sinoallii]